MNPQTTSTTATLPANGAAASHDLFALTDEQILEIEPEAVSIDGPQDGQGRDVPAVEAQHSFAAQDRTAPLLGAAEGTAAPTESAAVQTGPFSAPDDIRTLAELYPGGLSQAKTAAERARTLDEIDAAYFGAANSTPEQVSASRAQLALRMMREDPSAFREMVFAGLRALEAEGGDTGNSPAPIAEIVAHALRREAFSPRGGDRAVDRNSLTPEGVSYSGAKTSAGGHAAYAAFEHSANQELERSVGAAITRTIAQALPNLGREEGANSAGTRNESVSLRERLASSVRQDVESALKGDRQLGEQIAQILAAKRFDDATRAQVVRLINDRAQQLVPGAARRVIGEWTSATLAAHGAKSERSAAASSRREVAAASSPPSARAQHAAPLQRAAAVPRPRGVDYRKLSDEQILDL